MINFPDTAIAAGAAYWLAENTDTAIIYYKSDSNYQTRSIYRSFTSDFPSSLSGLSWSPNSGYLALAGWSIP